MDWASASAIEFIEHLPLMLANRQDFYRFSLAVGKSGDFVLSTFFAVAPYIDIEKANF